MKPFDTDKMPWLFTPHGEGELNEYFSSDHSIVISETSKEVIASLSESRDRFSGKLIVAVFRLQILVFALDKALNIQRKHQHQTADRQHNLSAFEKHI